MVKAHTNFTLGLARILCTDIIIIILYFFFSNKFVVFVAWIESMLHIKAYKINQPDRATVLNSQFELDMSGAKNLCFVLATVQ